MDAFAEELEDRFGALPDEVDNLLALGRLRALSQAAGAASVVFGPKAVALDFAPSGAKRIRKAGVAGEALRWSGDRLLYDMPEERGKARLDAVTDLLERIAHL